MNLLILLFIIKLFAQIIILYKGAANPSNSRSCTPLLNYSIAYPREITNQSNTLDVFQILVEAVLRILALPTLVKMGVRVQVLVRNRNANVPWALLDLFVTVGSYLFML